MHALAAPDVAASGADEVRAGVRVAQKIILSPFAVVLALLPCADAGGADRRVPDLVVVGPVNAIDRLLPDCVREDTTSRAVRASPSFPRFIRHVGQFAPSQFRFGVSQMGHRSGLSIISRPQDSACSSSIRRGCDTGRLTKPILTAQNAQQVTNFLLHIGWSLHGLSNFAR